MCPCNKYSRSRIKSGFLIKIPKFFTSENIYLGNFTLCFLNKEKITLTFCDKNFNLVDIKIFNYEKLTKHNINKWMNVLNKYVAFI
jgi:hypothetical protein